MALYTSGGAALTGEADVKGHLREGYFADLAILSDDFFSVPDDDISHIESVLTLVGGNVVYAAGPFEGLDPRLSPCRSRGARWASSAVPRHAQWVATSPRRDRGRRRLKFTESVA